MGTPEPKLLIDNDVGAAFDHIARAAAMAGGVAKPHRRNVVDEHFGAALRGLPGVGTAASAVHAGIAHAQGGPAVNEDVRRTADGRASDGVRAAVLAVAVGGAEGFVAYAAGWGHGGLLCVLYLLTYIIIVSYGDYYIQYL